MLRVLEERVAPKIPIELFPMATRRSAGKSITFFGREYRVLDVEEGIPEVDFALFSAGSHAARAYAPVFVSKGAVVIDNSSAYRMDERVPLVVPQVNPQDAHEHQGIIANPNCSTIQMVIFLKPLLDAFGIEEVNVVTFQAVSGAGYRGIFALEAEEDGGFYDHTPFAKRIHRNVIPQIGDFREGYSTEEWKMINETRKILHADIPVNPTAVRVPVKVGHSEAVHVLLDSAPPIEDVYKVLRDFPGLILLGEDYITPMDVEGRDEVFVGRLRFHPDNPRLLSAWVVADNLRRGAATNAVEILQLLSGV